MESIRSLFPPAERALRPSLETDFHMISETHAAFLLTKVSRRPGVVLNEACQVVFANEAFLELAGAGSTNVVLGRRLGEILGCSETDERRDDCPKSAECTVCRSAQAVTRALQGIAGASQVELRVDRPDHDRLLAFTVTAIPVRRRDRRFALLQFDVRSAA